MKTAISIPDQIFSEAEKLAIQLGISRSELYTKAICKLLAEQQQASQITQTLNEVYEQENSDLDAALVQMQVISIHREDW